MWSGQRGARSGKCLRADARGNAKPERVQGFPFQARLHASLPQNDQGADGTGTHCVSFNFVADATAEFVWFLHQVSGCVAPLCVRITNSV